MNQLDFHEISHYFAATFRGLSLQNLNDFHCVQDDTILASLVIWCNRLLIFPDLRLSILCADFYSFVSFVHLFLNASSFGTCLDPIQVENHRLANFESV